MIITGYDPQVYYFEMTEVLSSIAELTKGLPNIQVCNLRAYQLTCQNNQTPFTTPIVCNEKAVVNVYNPLQSTTSWSP